MLRNFFAYLVLYISFFSVEFNFIPIRIRYMFLTIGFLDLVRRKDKLQMVGKDLRRKWSRLIVCFVVFFLVIIVSSLYNGNFDNTLLKYPISVFISFLSAYGVLVVFFHFYHKREFDTYDLMRCIIMITLFECLFALLLFLMPPVRTGVMSLIKLNALAEDAYNSANTEARLMGVGLRFFGGGIVAAIVLYFISIMLNRIRSIKDTIKYLVIAVLVIAIGTMVARTALVGLAFFVVGIIMTNGILTKKKLVLYGSIAVIVMLAVNVYITYFESNPVFELAFERAFSMFTSYQNTGSLGDMERYVGDFDKPTDTMTWLLGDALMADPKNPLMAYYKGIDIGIWRLIWGYGIVGLLMYCLIQLYICMLTGFRKTDVWVLFFMCIVFLQKGLMSMDVILSSFIMLNVYNAVRRPRREKNFLLNNPKKPKTIEELL